MALVATTVFLTFVTGIVIFVYRCAAFRDKFIIVGNCLLAVVDVICMQISLSGQRSEKKNC